MVAEREKRPSCNIQRKLYLWYDTVLYVLYVLTRPGADDQDSRIHKDAFIKDEHHDRPITGPSGYDVSYLGK
jgi:hypothetical protein